MPAEITAVHPVLMARDVGESLEFYARFGFAEVFRDAPEAPRYAGVRRGPVELHLQWADAGQWAHSGDRPAYRFPTPDVDALYAEAAAAGTLVGAADGPYGSPADTPWGTREFHVRDPGANVLQFYGPPAAGRARAVYRVVAADKAAQCPSPAARLQPCGLAAELWRCPDGQPTLER
jgi:catechol 2,3-dioxygenase-like lactoylglutathione lyase family enzyme